MSTYLIHYSKSEKLCSEVKSKEEFIKLRSRRRHNELLSNARKGDKSAKRKLLQFNYSCVPSEDMRLKGCKTPSTSVGMDIDLDDESVLAALPEKILSKKEELGLLMLERSVSKGYHVVFRRREELTQEDNLRWASKLLGVPYDSNAKDITRVFFASSASADDLIYVSDELFEVEVAPVVKKSAAAEKADEAAVAEATMLVSKDAESVEGDVSMETVTVDGAYPELYQGKPYREIVANLQELMGGAPEHGNRNQFIFAMACQLRHICNDDAKWVASILPTYGESGEKWMDTIRSACSRNQTVTSPRLLRQAIEMTRTEAETEAEVCETQQEPVKEINRGALPMGIRECALSVNPEMLMPVLVTICPMIGTLATNVKVSVHGQKNSLNLLSYVVGNAASGKGSLDQIVEAWMKEIQEQDDVYHSQESEYRRLKRISKNTEEQPDEPKLPVRYLTFNNTVANLSERLANAAGTHSFSFTPEADTVTHRWKNSMSDYSVMLRQAYDASRYDREARSAEAVTVHIKRLLWNVVMCGTKDALYRVISNCTDGLLTRFAIAKTPDNTFAPLSKCCVVPLSDEARENISRVAHLLQVMEGELNLPKLEAKGERWLEKIRLEAMKNDDRTMASQRMRICVTTQRMVTAMMLCQVAGKLLRELGPAAAERLLKGNPAVLQELMEKEQKGHVFHAFDVIADTLLETVLELFRSRIENATLEDKQGQGSRMTKGKNDTIYDSLPKEFTFDQAATAKGRSCSRNSVKMMLRNWITQGLIRRGENSFCKTT